MSENSSLARDLLKEQGEMRVDVLQVRQTSPTSIVLTFRHENKDYQDRFSATPEQIDQLLLERAGKNAFATIKPDDATDKDFDPQVVSVEIVGND